MLTYINGSARMIPEKTYFIDSPFLLNLVFSPPGVNFTNVIHAPFSYERFAQRFFCTYVQENAPL